MTPPELKLYVVTEYSSFDEDDDAMGYLPETWAVGIFWATDEAAAREMYCDRHVSTYEPNLEIVEMGAESVLDGQVFYVEW